MVKTTLLVTGGAGFIGSAFVRLAAKKGYNIVVIDKLTYSGDLKRLEEAKGKYRFYKADICDSRKINIIVQSSKPDIIVNFAAETHVDRSIRDAVPFLETNIKGTQVLLDAARRGRVKKFVHMSTDEVYGEIEKGRFRETDPLSPNSPYAASKAAADLLIKSYIRTYGVFGVIVRPCNNYGPWQYPEKLIPLFVLKILGNQKVPLYGDGKNVREWLYVDDCAQAVLSIVKKGRCQEVYNVGSGREQRNIEVVHTLLKALGADSSLIKFVKDRPGHDRRYSLDSAKMKKETSWMPQVSLETGLKKTVEWCLSHKEWLKSKWDNVAPLYK